MSSPLADAQRASGGWGSGGDVGGASDEEPQILPQHDDAVSLGGGSAQEQEEEEKEVLVEARNEAEAAAEAAGADDAAAGGDGDNGANGGEEDDEEFAAADLEALPPFANKVNRELDALVKEREAALTRTEKELREHHDRVAVMQEHLKAVRAELAHTQELAEAKLRDVQTEDHLKQLAERETERVRADLTRTERLISETQDAVNVIQNNNLAAAQRLEEFKKRMKWNQDELLQWSLAVKQKEDDREVLERYKRTDDVRVKQLVLKLEKTTKQMQDKKEEMALALTETQAVQIELDKTADDYRRLHEERQLTIQQWHEVELTAQKRDKDIIAAGERVAELRARVQQLNDELRLRSEELKQQELRVQHGNVEIAAAERSLEKARVEYSAAGEGQREFEDEILAMRNELAKITQETTQAQRTSADLTQRKEEAEAVLTRLERELAEAQEQVKKGASGEMDAQARAREVEALHRKHQLQVGEVEKELRMLKENMFRKGHDLFELRRTEASLIAQISSAQSASRNLQGHIQELDQRSLKQQQMLYNIEFQVQQLERKVSYAGGKRSFEETQQLNKRIAELKELLVQQTAQLQLVTNQVRRLGEDLRQAQRRGSDMEKEIGQVSERIGQLQMQSDAAEHELRATRQSKEKAAVEHDTLKLEVKRLRDQLLAASDAVLDLESRKAQLDLTIAEREREMRTAHETQRMEIKVAEEARHRVALELKDRQLKVEKLKQKFEVVAARTAGAPGGTAEAENGSEERSQAYYVIAAAQEREELVRRGDELNGAIQRAEKELLQLNNTLSHLSGRNEAFRQSFRRADAATPEAQAKAQLEEQLRELTDAVFKHKSYLRELAADFQERRTAVAQLRNSATSTREEVAAAEAQVEAARKALEQQAAALQRATRAAEEAAQSVAAAAHVTPEATLHVDLHVRKHKNEVLLALLAQVADKAPGGEVVTRLLAERGVALDAAEQRPRTADSQSSASSRGSRGSRVSNASATRHAVRPAVVQLGAAALGGVASAAAAAAASAAERKEDAKERDSSRASTPKLPALRASRPIRGAGAV